MKKILALLCAVLLLAASCASAEGGTIVEFRDKIQLNGALPQDYHFSLIAQADDTLEGQLVSDNAAAPVFEIYIAFNDSYAQAGSLKDLDQEAIGIIGKSVDKYVVKSKTVNAVGIELTAEVRVKNNETAFVNEVNGLAGVSGATLVSYNGDYMA